MIPQDREDWSNGSELSGGPLGRRTCPRPDPYAPSPAIPKSCSIVGDPIDPGYQICGFFRIMDFQTFHHTGANSARSPLDLTSLLYQRRLYRVAHILRDARQSAKTEGAAHCYPPSRKGRNNRSPLGKRGPLVGGTQALWGRQMLAQFEYSIYWETTPTLHAEIDSTFHASRRPL